MLARQIGKILCLLFEEHRKFAGHFFGMFLELLDLALALPGKTDFLVLVPRAQNSLYNVLSSRLPYVWRQIVQGFPDMIHLLLGDAALNVLVVVPALFKPLTHDLATTLHALHLALPLFIQCDCRPLMLSQKAVEKVIDHELGSFGVENMFVCLLASQYLALEVRDTLTESSSIQIGDISHEGSHWLLLLCLSLLLELVPVTNVVQCCILTALQLLCSVLLNLLNAVTEGITDAFVALQLSVRYVVHLPYEVFDGLFVFPAALL
mmetsp:Transcript_3745/g.5792  ORF Transcript_3745/g.5792 Transcript_3745/m.5792 type:complete len:264 (+) Transcript_3745:1907-2698(+)